MVAIEHRQKRTTTTTTTTTNGQQQQHHHHNERLQEQQLQDQQVIEEEEEEEEQQQRAAVENSSMSSKHALESAELAKKHKEAAAAAIAKSSAISQRGVDIKIGNKSNVDHASKELTKKVLKLDLSGKELDEYSLKSPKSPISAARLSHQTSLTSSVDVEDRKTLREALYQGIFHRHRRTIFAVGSFLRMLRSRNSQYNTIRSSSEGEDVDEAR